MTDVQGYCPHCGSSGLFLAKGGYVTCPVQECRRPDAAADILADREIDHIVQLHDETFTIRHPLRERLDDALMGCALHTELYELPGPPRKPGRYRVYGSHAHSLWEELT